MLTPEQMKDIVKALRTVSDALNTIAAVLAEPEEEISPLARCPACGAPRRTGSSGSSILHFAQCRFSVAPWAPPGSGDGV